MSEIGRLVPGDERALEAFFAERPDGSIFIRSHLHVAGLVAGERPEASLWAASRVGGRIVAVAVHAWNGVLLVEARGHAGALASWLAARSGRKVRGITGPADDVDAARAALGLADAAVEVAVAHALMSAEIRRIALPAELVLGEIRVRHPYEHEAALLIDWRVAAAQEAREPGSVEALREAATREIRETRPREHQFIALSAGVPVATASFNAALPDIVQIGTVYVPPALRGRGYARCAVAAALNEARGRGVKRGVLLVEPGNVPALRAYDALGFAPAGAHRLVVFRAEPGT